MSTTVTIDGVAREYKPSQMSRYNARLGKPGNGLGACKVPGSTVLTENAEGHLLKSVSPAGTGQRASLTLRDVVERGDGTSGEVTVVVNIYHDDTHSEDLTRAGLMIAAGATLLTASSNQVLTEMADLGAVEV